MVGGSKRQSKYWNTQFILLSVWHKKADAVLRLDKEVGEKMQEDNDDNKEEDDKDVV